MSAKVEKGEVFGWMWACDDTRHSRGLATAGSRPTRDQARADAEAHNAQYHSEEAAA